MLHVKNEVVLKEKDLLTLEELTSENIHDLLALAIDMKKNGHEKVLNGKVLAMIFQKSSTRTRVSFEVGMVQLGGQGMYLSGNDIQLGRGETIADTAKVLSRYVDGIMIRTFSHESVEELAKHATVPVINGLTDDHHPCQALADIMTILEEKGTFENVKLAYIGDGNNVCHSLLLAAAKVGLNFTCATPKGHEPSNEIVEKALLYAKETGAQIKVTNNPMEAVSAADFIYSDVWASMGQEDEQEERVAKFQSYQVNSELVQYAKDDYAFMHCLPAHRGEEVAADIIDGQHSIVFDQAENRMHVQKALMSVLMK